MDAVSNGANLSIKTLHDVRRALLRHKRKAIVFFVLTMVVVAMVLVAAPREYRSEGVLFVRPSVQNLAKDPTAIKDHSFSINQSQETEVNSIVEILRSQAMAEKVIDAVGVDAILASAPRGGMTDEARAIDREKAVKQVIKNLEVAAPKQSNVIHLEYDAHSPVVAQQVLASLLDAYVDQHVRVNRTAGSYEFFAQQTLLLKEQLRQQIDELRAVKSELGVASIDGKRRILEDQVNAIESQIFATETQLATAQAKVDALTETIALLPQFVQSSTVTGLPNPAADGMRQQLSLLRVRQQDLLAKYTEEHPEVKSIRAQVAELEKLVAGEAPLRTQETNAANPAREKLQLDLLTEQSLLASLTARAGNLQTQHDKVFDQLKLLNSTEVRVAELQRNVDMTEENYRSYANKLEEARIYHELESKRISNVSIVQSATLARKPVSPKIALVLITGLFIATTGAFAVAMLCEFLDTTLDTRDEVEAALDLPVLVTIPRIAARDVQLN